MCAFGGIVHLIFFGSLVFQPPKEMPDLALECAVPLNAKAEPVEMPTATGFLVGDGKTMRLEDRFEVFELWRLNAIRARWVDADSNRFSICRIPYMIPDSCGETRTRADFLARHAKAEAALGPKRLDALDDAVYLLAPVEVTERFAPRRSQRRNLSALWQYATTNETAENAFVYAFRPRAEGKVQTDWYMVSLVSDDPDAEEIIDEWLDEVEWCAPDKEKEPSRSAPKPSEVDLLAADYRRNVVNYEDWHFASASNLVVVDNMQEVDRRSFLDSLTNAFLKMQAAYRKVLPSPLAADSHLAAVRVFGSRAEYLGYVGADMKFSGALWSPRHRELVLYYPSGGSKKLLSTVWHEALHQHLSYACSMSDVPVWFNEGHAELFEHSHFDLDGNLVFDVNSDAAHFIHQNAAELAAALPVLLDMDHKEFYAGSDQERHLKYRLSWSLAYFLQVGAPNVRFQPFKNLRADLMAAVVRTGRSDEAMRIALSGEMRKKLEEEWLAFWKKQYMEYLPSRFNRP